MPGKIGDAYVAALGGGLEDEALVKRIGKPFDDVYNLALKTVNDLSRVCMVGDALETDVTGAHKAGISSIWVMENGIHSPDLQEGESLSQGANRILSVFNQQDGTYAKGVTPLNPDILLRTFEW
jgi:ribonucleotide monophosphatase NagD (HAD superfamily)